MSSNEQRDQYGNFRDNSGTPYQTPDNKPPISGTSVTTWDSYGQPQTGIWSGGTVHTDKK